ncbi:hypothetical protein PCAR4_140080 [Paraburkholderia caribensis]|nr:hypothetical protein PCAR4_140080 [Paraburkholderia caribensis]
MGPERADALAKLEARDLKIVWRKSIQGSVEGTSARAAWGPSAMPFYPRSRISTLYPKGAYVC